ncbi:hypothetical protein GF357_03515, partial [Candidatus Dojkabacteria bacterium]|nr:hypothetical protein [Candidatus Dojkabacteria bacterium]
MELFTKLQNLEKNFYKSSPGFKKYFKYIFLTIFVLNCLPAFPMRVGIMRFLRDIIFNNRLYVTLIDGIVGFLTLLVYRFEIKKYINEHDKLVESQGNAASKITHSIRDFAKKIHIENLVDRIASRDLAYSLLAFVIVCTGTALMAMSLGKFDFMDDEYEVLAAAKGFMETGTFYKWDWIEDKSGAATDCVDIDVDCEYTRAWIHTIMVAASYVVFGVSEWASRVISIFWGMIFLISSYFFTKRFTKDNRLSILVLILLALHPRFIEIFRTVRMYAVLLPAFILLTYYVYRFFTSEGEIILKNKKIASWIKQNLGFNYFIGLILFFLIIFNYLVHINSLIILPVMIIFSVFLAIYEKKRRNYILLFMGAIATIVAILLIENFPARFSEIH